MAAWDLHGAKTAFAEGKTQATLFNLPGARASFARGGATYDDGPPVSSFCSAERSVVGVLYVSTRATRVCLAFARPRPIGSTPSLRSAGDQPPGWKARVATPTE